MHHLTIIHSVVPPVSAKARYILENPYTSFLMDGVPVSATATISVVYEGTNVLDSRPVGVEIDGKLYQPCTVTIKTLD
jgi:hypothetical protein